MADAVYTTTDEWHAMKDSDDKTVYFNAETHEATYDRPTPGKPVQTVIQPSHVLPWSGLVPPLKTKGPRPLEKRQHMQDHTDGNNEMRLPIGNDRYVTVNVFKGKLYIHIREFFFNQAGRMLPTSKGIALTPQQWFKLTEMQSAVDDAIDEMQPMDAKRPTLAERRNAPPLKFQAVDEAGCFPQHPDGTLDNTK